MIPTSFALSKVETATINFNAVTQFDLLGRTWVKAIQFPSAYGPNTGGIGDFATATQNDVAKLSDAQINALTNGKGVRVYRVEVSHVWKEGWEDTFMYVSTDQPHVDTSASFGAVGEGTFVKLGSSLLDVRSTKGWSKFQYTWWDNMHSDPPIAGQGCERMFIGFGMNDCWKEPGVRCFRGGAGCRNMEYPKVCCDWYSCLFVCLWFCFVLCVCVCIYMCMYVCVCVFYAGRRKYQHTVSKRRYTIHDVFSV